MNLIPATSPLRLVHPFPLALQPDAVGPPSPLARLDGRVQQVIRHWLADLAQPFALAKLAAAVHLCPRQLERLFLQETQHTPLHYLKRLRLERAAVLLATTDKEIKDLREEVGLSDASHFGRDFKRLFGLSPAHYRRAQQRE